MSKTQKSTRAKVSATRSKKAPASKAKKAASVKVTAAAAARPKAKEPAQYVLSSLDNTRRLRAVSPVTAPLGYRHVPAPALEADGSPAIETPQQRERALAKATRRQFEDQLWDSYLSTHDEDSRNNLWVHYQPLVRYISERLKAKLPECIDVCDLIGSGNIGLQDAIVKFDPSMGVRFETYCVPRIRGAILDSIRALDWVPRLIRNKSHQFARVVRELAAELHREPREDEIAARLNMTAEEFCELQQELNVKAQISVEGCAKDNTDERDLMRLEMLESRREVEPQTGQQGTTPTQEAREGHRSRRPVGRPRGGRASAGALGEVAVRDRRAGGAAPGPAELRRSAARPLLALGFTR